MVETNKASTSYNESDSIIAILRKASEDGTLEEIAKWQEVDINELVPRLEILDTEAEQIELLLYEYVCLYFFVCEIKGVSTQEFRDLCKTFEDLDDLPELYIYFVHGWLWPHIVEMRKQNKLHRGTKYFERFFEEENNYEGEMNLEDQLCGEGKLVDTTIHQRTRRGLWFKDNCIFCELTYKNRHDGYIYQVRIKDEETFGHWNGYQRNRDIENAITLRKRL